MYSLSEQNIKFAVGSFDGFLCEDSEGFYAWSNAPNKTIRISSGTEIRIYHKINPTKNVARDYIAEI